MILIVEGSDSWIEFYKSSLGSLELDIFWARTLPEAHFAWRMHGFEITAVVLDETLINEHGDSRNLAHEITADWSARQTNGVLVLTTDLGYFRRDVELEGFSQALKAEAIRALLSYLP